MAPIPADIPDNLICRTINRITATSAVKKEKGRRFVVPAGTVGRVVQIKRDDDGNVVMLTFWILKTTDHIFSVDINTFRSEFETSGRTHDEAYTVYFPTPSLKLLIKDAPVTGGSESQVMKAINAHFTAWRLEEDLLRYTPRWFQTLIHDVTAVEDLTRYMYMAFQKAGTLKLLDDPNINAAQLLELVEITTATHRDLGGIYIQLYKDFADDSPYSKALDVIIGSTNSFSSRLRDHQACYVDPEAPSKSFHYARAQSAHEDSRFTRVIATAEPFSQKGVESFRLRLIFEQMMFGIFGSYRKTAVKKGQESFTVGMNVASLQGFDEGSYTPVLNKIIANYNHDVWAATWDLISRRACTLAGWTPILDRPSFIPDDWRITKVNGLNRQSPCTYFSPYANDPMVWLWTTFDDPEYGPIDNYQRLQPSRLLRSTKPGQKDHIRSINLDNGAEGHIHFIIPSVADGPAAGDEVRFIFEVRRDGPHPYSYFGLPDVGPYEDWDLINGVAVRINFNEMDDDKSAKIMYAKRSRVMQMREGGAGVAHPVPAGYHADKALRYYLEGIKVERPSKEDPAPPGGLYRMRPGDYNFGLAIVRKLELDYYSHTITVHPPRGPSTERPVFPSSKTLQSLRSEMKFKGLTHIGRSNTTFTDAELKQIRPDQTTKTMRCDRCQFGARCNGERDPCKSILLAEKLDIDIERYPEYKNVYTCSTCIKLLLPCSFTSMRSFLISPHDESATQCPNDPTLKKLMGHIFRQVNPQISRPRTAFDRPVLIVEQPKEDKEEVEMDDPAADEEEESLEAGLTAEEVAAAEEAEVNEWEYHDEE